MADAIEIVQEFCDVMAKRDAESIRRFLADGAVYQNCGMAATVGVEAIVDNIGHQISMFPNSYGYEVKNIAANGDVVLTERLDMIEGPDGTIHAVPVMGTFVLEGGKIARWTDYFDSALPGRMISGDDVSALVPAAY